MNGTHLITAIGTPLGEGDTLHLEGLGLSARSD
jgi:hypothetical protein